MVLRGEACDEWGSWCFRPGMGENIADDQGITEEIVHHAKEITIRGFEEGGGPVVGDAV